jgi:hypothetical protein
MFAKDFDAFNNLYNDKIIKESIGLGPRADQDIVPSANKFAKIEMPPKKSCGCEEEEHCAAATKGCKCNGCPECKANQNKEKSEDCEGYDSSSYDSNGQMAKQLLYRCAKLSAMLHDILSGKDNIEAWVLSKITNAHDQLESVFGYEDYEAAKNPMHGTCGAGNFEESNEEELFAAIARGGDELLSNLKNALRKESKDTLEQVLLETILILEEKNKKS